MILKSKWKVGLEVKGGSVFKKWSKVKPGLEGLAGFVGWLLEKVLTTKITGSEAFFSDDYFFR